MLNRGLRNRRRGRAERLYELTQGSATDSSFRLVLSLAGTAEYRLASTSLHVLVYRRQVIDSSMLVRLLQIRCSPRCWVSGRLSRPASIVPGSMSSLFDFAPRVASRHRLCGATRCGGRLVEDSMLGVGRVTQTILFLCLLCRWWCSLNCR